MQIQDFISKQSIERQILLNEMHAIIIKSDNSVKAEVGLMMGKEMIIYKAAGNFKYGLASVKNYMSLHAMPIYVSAGLYSRYQDRLKKANFQKGCINFKNAEEMPLDIVEQFIKDCSKIDLLKIKQEYIKSRKSTASK
ncbi:MAG: hypothetical protein ABJA37_07340 [Ferruginibacter sp.]